jgi:cytochrome c biogenesis protein ResB
MDSIKQGWISAGSFRYRPKYLILNRNDILALTEPEPKKYSSLVEVRYNGTIENHDIEVNKPHKVMGWKIYQMGYDTRMGKWSELSVLEVVKDPWLPVVYIGFFMLIAGAIYLFWIGRDVKVKKEEENI